MFFFFSVLFSLYYIDFLSLNNTIKLFLSCFAKLLVAHFVHPKYKIKIAQAEWEEMLEKEEQTWVLCYHVGMARLHRALSKSCLPASRQAGVMKAMGMLKQYQKLRMRDIASMDAEVQSNIYREVWYNMGRAFHYLDIIYLALDCYCRALSGASKYVNAGETLEEIVAEELKESKELASSSSSTASPPLQRQVAHNLVLCLRTSPGMEHYARSIVRKYLRY